MSGAWSVYVLVTTTIDEQDKPVFSYCGATLDFARRLRQHNLELKSGGAKYTTNLVAAGYTWRPLFIVTGLETQKQALQLELCQKQKMASYRCRSLNTEAKKQIATVTAGYHRRVKVLAETLLLPKWTSQTDAEAIANLPLAIYWSNAKDIPSDWETIVPLGLKSSCRFILASRRAKKEKEQA